MTYDIIIADDNFKHLLYLIELFNLIGLPVYGAHDINSLLNYFSRRIPHLLLIKENLLNELTPQILTISKEKKMVTFLLFESPESKLDNSITSYIKPLSYPPIFIEEIIQVIAELDKNYRDLIYSLQDNEQLIKAWFELFEDLILDKELLSHYSIAFIQLETKEAAKSFYSTIANTPIFGNLLKLTRLYNFLLLLYDKRTRFPIRQLKKINSPIVSIKVIDKWNKGKVKNEIKHILKALDINLNNFK